MYRELNNGNIEISYEDYNVETFGGGDYEAIYTLTKENSDKLKEILKNENKEALSNLTLKELIINKFGPNLKKASFSSYCKANDIKYELQTYVH